MMLKVLLDSTYILPSFGIEVKGLSDEQISKLREAMLKGVVKFYCSMVSWIEVIGKVYRESKRLGLNVEETVDIAVKSLLESGFYEWINPSPKAIRLAFKLRKLGHVDNIDNLLYSTSITSNLIFLTMDDDFKEFLLNHNYETETLINHVKLLKELSRKLND